MNLRHLILLTFVINLPPYSQTSNLTRYDNNARFLLYPSLTDLQLTLCTVSPVFNRKFGRLATNLGFQLNFRLPWQLVDFYRPTYWARAAIDIITGKIRPAAESEENGRYYKKATGLTAGKMYKAIETFTEAMDFHPDCLVKSVCELAHVPFDSDEDHLVQQVIHFLLTPSEHLSFHNSEKIMQKRFEKAERAGRHKKDCNRLYQKCTQSLISLITAIYHELWN